MTPNVRGKITLGQKDKSVKRYYWLKLKEEFFLDKEVKKLRKIAGGDTYTIIYLKLMLLSLKSDGRLYFDGVEDTFHEELALEIDEDAENVRVTMMYLERMGLLKLVNEDELFLTQMENLIESESESAQRVRAFRARKKLTESGETPPQIESKAEDTEGLPTGKESETLHCNSGVTNCNTYTDTYIDTDTNTEKDKKKNKKEKVFVSGYPFSDSEVLQSAFNDFLAMRIAHKKPMTEKAILQVRKKLNDLSQDVYTQADILDQSTFHCWDGVYPLKYDYVSIRQRPNTQQKKPLDRYADYQ